MRLAETEAYSTVLLARIVDAAGKALLPSAVQAIEYSVVPINFNHDNQQDVAPSSLKRRADAEEVFAAELRRDSSWSVDAIGYNFRHSIDLAALQPNWPDHSFQLRYEIITIDGRTSVLRFHVRRIHHDRN